MRLIRTRKARWIAGLAVVVLAGYAMIAVFRGRDVGVPGFFRPPPGERLLMSMEGFQLTQSEHGAVAWSMHATQADLFESKQARLQDIEIIYTSEERGAVVLKGELGTLDTTSGDATIRGRTGDVRVVTNDGYLLTTPSLSWTGVKKVMKTPDPFKLLGPKIYLEGRGLTARMDSHTVVVEKDVKAVLQE